MNHLVNSDGRIDFGIIDSPVDEINYLDYHLESPLGKTKSRLYKRFRFNQFIFLGITGPDFIAGLAVVDINFLSNGFFYVLDTAHNRLHETKQVSHGRAARIVPRPEQMEANFSSDKLAISIQNGNLSATSDGMSLSARIDLSQVNPLRLCTRSGYRGWTYTQKSAPVPIEGSLSWNGETRTLSFPETLALTDWSAGFMRRETCWNWAALSWTLADHHTIGLNLSCGVNETSFTENVFWVDREMTQVDTVHFMFKADDLMAPWKIRSFDGKIDLDFVPENRRDENINIVFVASRFTQLMGRFTGTLTTNSGERIHIDQVPGFAEDHYAKF